MDELQYALSRLNAKREAALAKKAEAEIDAAKQKQVAWGKIQTDSHLAEFLTAVNATFGKPAKTYVRLNDEVLINTWGEN